VKYASLQSLLCRSRMRLTRRGEKRREEKRREEKRREEKRREEKRREEKRREEKRREEKRREQGAECHLRKIVSSQKGTYSFRHGNVATVISDRVGELSGSFEELLDLCYIDHRFTRPHHPQSNGFIAVST